MSKDARIPERTGGLRPEYQTYEQQRCFIGHSTEAAWSEDVISACQETLPTFGLVPWYAQDHFAPDIALRTKIVQAIANARCGIYDLSSWQDQQGVWHLPRNVLIELGMAIALNRPTLLLRHQSNKQLSLPASLASLHVLPFAGVSTLKKILVQHVPGWLNVPPEHHWLNRLCLLSRCSCDFREQHPRAQPSTTHELHCHVADGLDEQGPPSVERQEMRDTFDDVLRQYDDLVYHYLDDVPLAEGYQFQICSLCQTVRSTSFAIYHLLPQTPAEVFITIGMSIALETVFEYSIPKVLLVRNEAELPSLLRGYEVVEAGNSLQIAQKLKKFIPTVMGKVRLHTWQPQTLPFIDPAAWTPEPEQAPIASAAVTQVLIVDDSARDRQRLRQLLAEDGYAVTEAVNNEQALAALADPNNRFSLVLTDALRGEQPDESGYVGLELVRILTQQFPQLPVVLVSYDSEQSLRQRAPDLRAATIVAKTLPDQELRTVFQRLLAAAPMPPEPTERYDVLLSHNTADTAIVTALAERLRGLGLRIWLDRWAIQEGDDISDSLAKGLASSQHFMLCVGATTIGRWQALELETVVRRLAQQQEDGKLVVVLLPGADPQSLPQQVHGREIVDLRQGLDDERAIQQLLVASNLVPKPVSPIDYYSCFISYSSRDEALARRLYSDLQAAGVRCWFAPHDRRSGESILDGIDRAIRLHDKMLLILSQASIESRWVQTEVRQAQARELRERRRVLFPIRIDDAVRQTGHSWARELWEELQIGDFTRWKEHDAYQAAFARLLRDLKAGGGEEGEK